jgi:hypothetical protein
MIFGKGDSDPLNPPAPLDPGLARNLLKMHEIVCCSAPSRVHFALIRLKNGGVLYLEYLLGGLLGN